MKQAVLGIAFVLAIIVGVNYANAENGMVDYPTIPDANMIGQDVQVTYQTDNRWTITVTTQFQVNSILELPEIIYYPGIDGQIYSINLKDEFIIANDPMAYNSADDVEIVEDTYVSKVIEKKKVEMQDERDEVWGKYRVCMEEFEAEQPVRFEAWKRTSTLSEFEIPDESIAYGSANYSAEELKGERAWQVCEGIKNYQWIGVVEKNKVMEKDLPWKLDETNSPDTPEPVTQADKDVQAQIAQDFKCSPQGKHQGLCSDYLSGDYYVPRFSTPFWYGAYLEMRDTGNDADEAVRQSIETQCTNFYPLYEHKVGMDSFPQWLNHCIEETND